jgi:hypothetical protein
MTDHIEFAPDPAAVYLRIYREWRYVYGLRDPCIDEIKAAIVVESESDALSIEQKDRLDVLLCLIEREQAQQWECAA